MQNLDEIVERIYEAALVPQLWPQLLDELAPIADAPGGIIMGFPIDNVNMGKLVTNPAYDEIGARYFSEGWGEKNGRFARGLANGSALEPRFISEEDIFGAEDFKDDPLYKDLLLPAGLGRSIGTVVNHTHGDVVILTFERRLEDGPVKDSVRTLLDELRPHFARSSLLAYRLDFRQVETAVDTLEQLGLPAAAIRSDATVVTSGRLFEEEPQAISTRMSGKVALNDTKAQELFIEALGAITSIGGVRSIPLKEPGLPARKVLHVVPIRRSARDLFTTADALIALSISPEHKSVGGGVLSALFDLTPREAQVAAAIAQGKTIKDVAVLHSASPETVRNQLRIVLSKTGCGRQAELVRLVADLFPSGFLNG